MLMAKNSEMSNLITRTTELAMSVTLTYIKPGDTVVDATCGTGQDTVVLARAVGSEGSVYAFDIQKSAHLLTEARLKSHGIANVHLVKQSFVSMSEHIPEKSAAAVVFNLGWLPGGDHTVTTFWETTRAAVSKALNLLLPGGVLVLCAYPGHPEGDRERHELTGFFATLSNKTYNVLHQRFLNAGPGAPECFVVQKQI